MESQEKGSESALALRKKRDLSQTMVSWLSEFGGGGATRRV